MTQRVPGSHRPGIDEAELTQQFTPIFHALIRRGHHHDVIADGDEQFRRDPLAAALSPASLPSSDVVPTRALLRAVPGRVEVAGGAHRAEVHAIAPGAHRAGSRPAGSRSAGSGAHRAPDGEQHGAEPVDNGSAGRRGRHRTLRSVAH